MALNGILLPVNDARWRAACLRNHGMLTGLSRGLRAIQDSQRVKSDQYISSPLTRLSTAKTGKVRQGRIERSRRVQTQGTTCRYVESRSPPSR